MPQILNFGTTDDGTTDDCDIFPGFLQPIDGKKHNGLVIIALARIQ